VANEPPCRFVLEDSTLRDPVRMESTLTRRDLRVELHGHLREWRSMGPQKWRPSFEELVDKRVQLGGFLRIEMCSKSDLLTGEPRITSRPDQKTHEDDRAVAMYRLHSVQKP
jgi:hypothetical protein